MIKKLTLWFEKTGIELIIPFSNDPIYEMQEDLARQWIRADKDRKELPYTQLINWWARPAIEVNIKVETADEQLSWKNFDDETLTSRAEISIPYKDTVCIFRGYVMTFSPGSHFTFLVRHTLHGTDKVIGFSVSENNILLWTDSFPREILLERWSDD